MNIYRQPLIMNRLNLSTHTHSLLAQMRERGCFCVCNERERERGGDWTNSKPNTLKGVCVFVCVLNLSDKKTIPK